MKTQINKRPSPLILITGIAVILFSAAGTAAITGWGSTSTGGSSEILAPDDLPATPAEPVVGRIRARTKCAECGVIASIREITARDGDDSLGAINGSVAGNPDGIPMKSARYYEFTVRMTDRSIRLINDENPASWRLGERVMVIDSISASTR